MVDSSPKVALQEQAKTRDSLHYFLADRGDTGSKDSSSISEDLSKQ